MNKTDLIDNNKTDLIDNTEQTAADLLFADPVGFLASHGISAQLVEIWVEPNTDLATAA